MEMPVIGIDMGVKEKIFVFVGFSVCICIYVHHRMFTQKYSASLLSEFEILIVDMFSLYVKL
jgi:hypothetical protein